jgi:hypothetical protein
LALLGLVLQGARVDAQERPKVEIVPLIAHARDVSSAAFSRNGAHVLTGSEGGTLSWDIATTARADLRRPQGRRYRSRVAPDGACAVGRARTRRSELWEVALDG